MAGVNWIFHGIAGALLSSMACNGAALYTVKSTGNLVWEGRDINAKGELAGGGGFGNAIYYNGDYASSVAPLGGSGHYEYSLLRAINNNHFMVGQSSTGIVNDNTGPLG